MTILSHNKSLQIILIFLLLLSLWLLLNKPSNNRNFEFGMENPPHLTIQNNLITISNLRDFEYTTSNVTPHFINRTFDATKITRVWFVVEPFTKFKQIAHTYFIFDFSDQPPLSISVEARREKNENFNIFLGSLNQYELIYIWGTETDQTIRRVVVENNQLFMYPLNITPNDAKSLLLQLAETTQSLETNPRFYNTFTSNCTNELAKAANTIRPNAIPFNPAFIFPGYSADELYKLGLIPSNKPLSEITNDYHISNIVRENFTNPNFSTILRQQLTTNYNPS